MGLDDVTAPTEDFGKNAFYAPWGAVGILACTQLH